MKRKIDHSSFAFRLLGLVFMAFAAWSCSTDTDSVLSGADADPAVLNITVAPRPAYAAGTVAAPDVPAASATRVAQTAGGARWEDGEVLWLWVCFTWTPAGVTQPVKQNYVSALRYADPDGDGFYDWYPFTEQDCLDFRTGDIPPYANPDPDGLSYSGFVRHPRWPVEALAGGTTGAKAGITARYLGRGIPDKGILSMDYTVDAILAFTEIAPGEPVALSLRHANFSRVHVTEGATLSLKGMEYYERFDLSSQTFYPVSVPSKIIVPPGGGYYFVSMDGRSTVQLDGIFYTLAPVYSDGRPMWEGLSYTLTPVKNGSVLPGS